MRADSLISPQTILARFEGDLKGFVPTPPSLVDEMVDKLFRRQWPKAEHRLLDPGCGTGAFIEGVLKWCECQNAPAPQIVGVESDGKLLSSAEQKLRGLERVSLHHEDFLLSKLERFDFIVGNPPYVPITGLSVNERHLYRQHYATAKGRFDLYLLFFEKALSLLKPSGRLVFVTPEKFLYVQTAASLRSQLARFAVEEVLLVDEDAFSGLVTYPTITTVQASRPVLTRIVLRDGTECAVNLSKAGQSWAPLLNGQQLTETQFKLSAALKRVSCGVATGADEVFVVPTNDVKRDLRRFAHPTLAGREARQGNEAASSHSMLVPYDRSGRLLDEGELGALGDYLREPERHQRLLKRTCVARKPWYAFHETPPLKDILRPKVLCKDISNRPWFFTDDEGHVVPRHSLYYLVPKYEADLQALCEYLNSPVATDWLMAHCQRAANGFFRLQSHILRQMPLPEELAREEQLVAV